VATAFRSRPGTRFNLTPHTYEDLETPEEEKKRKERARVHDNPAWRRYLTNKGVGPGETDNVFFGHVSVDDGASFLTISPAVVNDRYCL